MKRCLMARPTRALAAALGFGWLLGFALHAASPAAAAELEVTGAWIRVLPGRLPAAGYVTLHNSTARELVLTGATSPAFGQVELHQSLTTADGQARMQRVESVSIPAQATVNFAPGGYHLMLMQPRRAITAGETVDIELTFADGNVLRVSFAARPANATGP